MPKKNNQKTFWDRDYLRYWRKRTEEKEKIYRGDHAIPNIDIINRYISKLKLRDNDKILDIRYRMRLWETYSSID